MLEKELTRQRQHIELIASENFVSEAVLAAMGSHLTNKYAEGYPGKRYYGGCDWVDAAERIAIERACKLFGAEHANVQPHAGAQANLAVYQALLNPGDTILGMNLAHGGHLTHEVRRLALEHKPRLIVAGASAYSRIIDFPRFREIADECGAMRMVDMAHIAGLVAAGEHPSPVPYADVVTTTTHKTLRGPRGGMILCREEYAKAIDKAIFPGSQGGPLMHIIAAKAVCFKEAMRPEFAAYQHQIVLNAKALAAALTGRGLRLVSGGTDNHLMLINLTGTGVTGKALEEMLGRVRVTANKNAVPFDTLKPTVTSGLRVGTPAVTTRGMKEAEMAEIGNIIADVAQQGEAALPDAEKRVASLCARFPMYE